MDDAAAAFFWAGIVFATIGVWVLTSFGGAMLTLAFACLAWAYANADGPAG
jgi:hypothetical protein